MNSILKYSPIITGILIFSGFLKLYIYYNFFSIDIINYLDFSEILTSFLDDIVLLFTIVILVIIIVLFPTLFLKSKFMKLIKSEKGDVAARSLKRYTYHNKLSVFILILVSIIIIGGSILIFFKVSELFGLVLGVLYLFNLICSVSIIKTGRTLEDLGLLLVVSIILFLATCLKTYKEFNDVKLRECKNYTIYTNDGIHYILKENDYIIGKTKNYLFFSLNKETLIIPEREIKKIKYRQVE